MRIEIICTGDEVLTGKIVNTNFSYMTQKLEDFGLSVSWGTTVGDDREELLAAFRLCAARADAVIVNTNFSYMTQKLEDFGLSVSWGTTVGDDREELLAAFRLCAARADAVIVNGGLGPT